MAITLKGVKRRKSSGPYYCEVRKSGSEKFFCNKIKSAEEGALFYDIVKLYYELEVDGMKRKTPVKLNYPEYSRTLRLKPWPSCKEEAMEIILKQAQAAVKNLPESLRFSTPFVCSSSPSNRSSSHQNVHGKPLVAKQDLPGVWTNQLNLQEISELSYLCNMSYTAKIIERERLEGNVADINENSGIIYPPERCPDAFTDPMAHLKQLMTTAGKIPGILEMAEQGYKSEESKCLELRKLVGDHNSKVIAMDDGSGTSGRRRANEDEILPRVL